MNDNYISLKEASIYSSYSQGYLSFQAKQQKLKAKKFGRNWVTKKEWIDDFKNSNKLESKSFDKNNFSKTPAFKILTLCLVLIFVLTIFGTALNNSKDDKIDNQVIASQTLAEVNQQSGNIFKSFFSWIKESILSLFRKKPETEKVLVKDPVQVIEKETEKETKQVFVLDKETKQRIDDLEKDLIELREKGLTVKEIIKEVQKLHK